MGISARVANGDTGGAVLALTCKDWYYTIMLIATTIIVGLLLACIWALAYTLQDMHAEIRSLQLEIHTMRQFCVQCRVAHYRSDNGKWELIKADDPIEKILRSARQG